MKKVLVDLAGSIKLQLTESTEGGKHLVARGEFGRADVPTQNRRVYPRKVWEREIQRINEAIASGKVLGELDHPADGKTSLKRVSHIMTGLHMQDDGVIIGEAKILDNEYGRQLKSILEAGGAIGVSSRGMGSTAMGEDGSEVVQEDYQYMTHDFVADPAVLTSYPKFQTEVRWIKPDSVVTENSSKETVMNKVEQKIEAVAPVVETKEKEQDNNAVPAEVKPEEVKPPEAKIEEPAAEVLAPVAESPALEATAEANIKAEAKDPHGAEDLEPSKHDEPSDAKYKELKKKKLAGDESLKGKTDLELATMAGMKSMHGEAIVTDEAQKLRESIKAELQADPAFAAAQIALESIKTAVRPFLLPEATASEKDEEINSLKVENTALKNKIVELGAVANRLGAHLHFERKIAEMKEDREEMAAIVGKQKLESVKHVDSILVEAKKTLESRKEDKRANALETKRLESKFEAKMKALEDQNKKLEESLKSTVSLSKELGIKLYISEKTRGNPNAKKIKELCEGKTERKDVDSILARFAVAPSAGEEYNAIKRRFEKLAGTSLVEDQLKETGANRAASGSDEEGVLGEMTDLFPGATLDQVKALM